MRITLAPSSPVLPLMPNRCVEMPIFSTCPVQLQANLLNNRVVHSKNALVPGLRQVLFGWRQVRN